MLKKKLEGPVVAIIIVLSLLGIVAAGLFYIKDPPKVTPEETLRMMTEHNARAAKEQGTGQAK